MPKALRFPDQAIWTSVIRISAVDSRKETRSTTMRRKNKQRRAIAAAKGSEVSRSSDPDICHPDLHCRWSEGDQKHHRKEEQVEEHRCHRRL